MAVPMDPTSAAFLFAENRRQPMHVGGLQLFTTPEGADRDYLKKHGEGRRHVQAIIALARRRVDVLWALLRDNRILTPDPPIAQAA